MQEPLIPPHDLAAVALRHHASRVVVDGSRPVRQKALVIAHAVHETGRRKIIGLDIGAAETEAFWTEFLRSLVARGLVGVKLAISDAREGLKTALAKVWGHRGSGAPCTSSEISEAMSTKTSTTRSER